MKTRELWTRMENVLRPPHVTGHDVNDAFIRGSEGAPANFQPSQHEKGPA